MEQEYKHYECPICKKVNSSLNEETMEKYCKRCPAAMIKVER